MRLTSIEFHLVKKVMFSLSHVLGDRKPYHSIQRSFILFVIKHLKWKVPFAQIDD